MSKPLSDTEPCCPRFDPTPWEGKTFEWSNKLFVKDTVRSFFHIPINMGKVITRMCNSIESAGAKTDDFMILSEETSLWKSTQYIPVSKEVPELEIVKISGTHIAKVFEGPYSEAGHWYSDMDKYISTLGKQMRKCYFYYTTCPKCAKIYGKNFVVAIAEV